MGHERQLVVCDFKKSKNAPTEQGVAFLIDGDVELIIRLVDGRPAHPPIWTYNLRYEHGCLPLFSGES